MEIEIMKLKKQIESADIKVSAVYANKTLEFKMFAIEIFFLDGRYREASVFVKKNNI